MNELNIIERADLPITQDLDELFEEVESATGERVVFRNIVGSYEGGSKVNEGVPTICLGANGRRTITICHELLHLRCETQGYPRTRTVAALGDYSVGIVKRTLEWIQGSIEHQVIFPQMIDLNYDPYADLERKTRPFLRTLIVHNPLNQNEIIDETNIDMHLKWSVHLLRPLAELDIPDIHEEIDRNGPIKCPKAFGKAWIVAHLIKQQPEWNQVICEEILLESINIVGIPEETFDIVIINYNE